MIEHPGLWSAHDLQGTAADPEPERATTVDDDPIECREQLAEVFRRAETAREEWLVGVETEKFGVHADSGAPLQYDGEHGVLRVLAALADWHGWEGKREHGDGPIIALQRGAASITLEPGAQLELSGAPHRTLHEAAAEMSAHLEELRAISQEMRLEWLASGYHPLARQEQLPWVPKQRYAIMREYLPPLGDGALDMMRRTATVQANLDYSSERDALRKLRVGLRATPILVAMTANSPFKEGCVSGKQTLRGDVWRRMDPSRSGLLPWAWLDREGSYQDYVEWALDAGMFLFKRGDELIRNTGQTFRSFLDHGFAGHTATMADWKLHLNTLFPEVRLKTTLELRCGDSLPSDLTPALPALVTGVLYDERALDEAEALLAPLSLEQVEAARGDIVDRALRAELSGRSLQSWAEALLDIGRAGLERRALTGPDGRDESVHLQPLVDLVARGMTPADRAIAGLDRDCPELARHVVARTRI